MITGRDIKKTQNRLTPKKQYTSYTFYTNEKAKPKDHPMKCQRCLKPFLGIKDFTIDICYKCCVR